MGEEILNLSTVVDRVSINIESKKHPNGKSYELRNLADLGPYEYALIFARNDEVAQLRKLKKLTAVQQRKLELMLDEMVKLLCPTLATPAEKAVLAALTDEQKLMIVVVWASHVTPPDAPGAAEGNRQSRRTTGASSRGSKRSTAAGRKTGSTRQGGRSKRT